MAPTRRVEASSGHGGASNRRQSEGQSTNTPQQVSAQPLASKQPGLSPEDQEQWNAFIATRKDTCLEICQVLSDHIGEKGYQRFQSSPTAALSLWIQLKKYWRKEGLTVPFWKIILHCSIYLKFHNSWTLVSRMEIMTKPWIWRLPVIQSLAEEVKQTTRSMLSQLLQRLRSNIQLPECLRVIGYLRRLGVFIEQEIRLQFLKCREAWLAGIIDDLDQNNVDEFLKRMSDYHRVHLFEVMTQYHAIFADDTSGIEENYDGGLLFSWAMHRITSYLNTLRALLPKITEGVSLSHILEESMYCVVSLGWVGLDFRGLLPALFEVSVQNLFVRNMAATVQNFQFVLDSHRWVPLPSVGLNNKANTDENEDGIAPPYALLEHPPLAIFVNVMELVWTVSKIGKTFMKRFSFTWSQFESLKHSIFKEIACPYCIRCFSRCYPGAISLTELNKATEEVWSFVGTPAPGLLQCDSGTNGSFSSDSLQDNHHSRELSEQVSLRNQADTREDIIEKENVIEDNGHQST